MSDKKRRKEKASGEHTSIKRMELSGVMILKIQV